MPSASSAALTSQSSIPTSNSRATSPTLRRLAQKSLILSKYLLYNSALEAATGGGHRSGDVQDFIVGGDTSLAQPD